MIVDAGGADDGVPHRREGRRPAADVSLRHLHHLGEPGRPARRSSLPCGVDADGLPIGLQIIGPPFDEEVVLRVARAFEAATTGIGCVPPISRKGDRQHDARRLGSVIGLEVHAELLTASKIFCGCSAAFGAPPNQHTCPVCLGMPGVLPVLNRRVVEFAVRAGLATHCRIAPHQPLGAQELLLPRPLQGLSDQPVRAADLRRPAASTSSSTAPAKRVAPHAHPHGGGHRQEHPRRARRRQPGRLQPLRRAAPRDRERARHAHAGRGRRVSAHAALASSSTSRSATATWRKAASAATPTSRCGRAAATTLGTKVEIKNMNSFRAVEQAIAYEIERQVRGARGRRARSSRRPGSGIADREETRTDAEQGVGARLPLLPRPRSAAARARPTPWSRRSAQRCPSCPTPRRARFVARTRPSRLRRRRADRAPRRRRLFRGRRSPPIANAKAASNWVMGDVLRLVRERKLDDALVISDWPVAPEHARRADRADRRRRRSAARSPRPSSRRCWRAASRRARSSSARASPR